MNRLLDQVFCTRYIQRLILSAVLIILIAQLVTYPANATGVSQIPSLSAGDRTWVIDQGEVLSRINENKISNELENLASQTGNEVRIVTFRRLDYGETAESFANKLFEKWFPTPVAQANQTLLVIDTLSSGTAIRTGDTTKLLTDDIAKSIVAETVLAPLRSGEKYNQAFLDASDRLVAVLSGKPDPGPPQLIERVSVEGTFKKAEETNTGSATIWVIGLLLAATIIPMATYYLYVR